MYRESWVCHLTHVGSFKVSKGISNIIKNYHELDNDLVSFDTAYDYIAVPISEKEVIEKFLQKSNLKCETREKSDMQKLSKEELKLKKLKRRIREEEVSIICEATIEELKMKGMALSFILQGYVYSLPLDLLFVNTNENGKMEMLIRYIDDDDAIWTFGYPFMNQFLTIFNMEDGQVGLKKLKKTSLPIVNINKDWEIWHRKKEGIETAGKTIAIIFLILVIIGLTFYVYRYIRRRIEDTKRPTIDIGNNEDIENNNKNRVY
jgi:cbb3-type cytochrome oxidase subunit 3